MTSLRDGTAKSAIWRPIGCWRRTFTGRLIARNARHRMRSASVVSLRSLRARRVFGRTKICHPTIRSILLPIYPVCTYSFPSTAGASSARLPTRIRARRGRAVRAASQPGPPLPVPLPSCSFPSTPGASSARLSTRHAARGAVAPFGPNGPGGRRGNPTAGARFSSCRRGGGVGRGRRNLLSLSAPFGGGERAGVRWGRTRRNVQVNDPDHGAVEGGGLAGQHRLMQNETPKTSTAATFGRSSIARLPRRSKSAPIRCIQHVSAVTM